MITKTRAEFATADALGGLDGINHAFFTRKGGVSKGIYASLNAGLGSNDVREHVVTNRQRMTDALGVDADDLASPYQVHSNVALITKSAWRDDRPKADGVATDIPGLALGIVTADCGPVLFADPKKKVIGACHAGWKGALGGILENTIATMMELGAEPQNITATLGPTISQKNYEVGPEFPNLFIENDQNNEQYFTPSLNSGHHMFDLPRYIVDRLRNAGAKASYVGLCTYEGDSFFSFRRTTHNGDADYGRQLSAIVLQ